MILWFAGLAFVLVWSVFRDPALDYRLVMMGAVLPDLVDRRLAVLHSVVPSAVLLGLVMVATRGRRALRRRLLAVPIGTFMHLVLDAAWADGETFWWPLSGWEAARRGIPVADRPVALLVTQEIAGLVALVWCWRRFRLDGAERNEAFARTGRLGRDVV